MNFLKKFESFSDEIKNSDKLYIEVLNYRSIENLLHSEIEEITEFDKKFFINLFSDITPVTDARVTKRFFSDKVDSCFGFTICEFSNNTRYIGWMIFYKFADNWWILELRKDFDVRNSTRTSFNKKTFYFILDDLEGIKQWFNDMWQFDESGNLGIVKYFSDALPQLEKLKNN